MTEWEMLDDMTIGQTLHDMQYGDTPIFHQLVREWNTKRLPPFSWEGLVNCD